MAIAFMAFMFFVYYTMVCRSFEITGFHRGKSPQLENELGRMAQQAAKIMKINFTFYLQTRIS